MFFASWTNFTGEWISFPFISVLQELCTIASAHVVLVWIIFLAQAHTCVWKKSKISSRLVAGGQAIKSLKFSRSLVWQLSVSFSGVRYAWVGEMKCGRFSQSFTLISLFELPSGAVTSCFYFGRLHLKWIAFSGKLNLAHSVTKRAWHRFTKSIPFQPFEKKDENPRENVCDFFSLYFPFWLMKILFTSWWFFHPLF